MSLVNSTGASTPPAAGATDLGQNLLMKSLDTAELLTSKAAGTNSAAEAKDYAAAVLSLAQVIALLDPAKDAQGIPLEHHAAMQQMKGALELEKVKQQAKAQPPSPKKTVNVKRDSSGRATSYQEG